MEEKRVTETNIEVQPSAVTEETGIVLIVPRDDGNVNTISIPRKKALAFAGLFAVVFVCLAGAAGFYGWQYHRSKIDKTAYQEYMEHKTEQEAKLQSLLEDNEKNWILSGGSRKPNPQTRLTAARAVPVRTSACWMWRRPRIKT